MFIKPFTDITKNDASTAGGKGASLGEMTSAFAKATADKHAGYNPIPPGYVILSGAFEKFVKQAELTAEIDSILHSVKTEEVHTIENASEQIQALILNAEMPKEIQKDILLAFNNLNSPFVAVRSSATAEDSVSAAWAGQLESYLNTTKETLLENVKKCWASLFTPRAIFYRFEKNLHSQSISVAVVVQKMIQSEKSGIAFSVHPVTQDRSQMIIEAGYGLGEAIVSGQITPDSYVVEKHNSSQPPLTLRGGEKRIPSLRVREGEGELRILDKTVSTQERMLIRGKNSGTEWIPIPKTDQAKQKLTDAEILELSALILKIDNHYGFPVDVEFAQEKGKFYIVQSRPITTLRVL